MADVNPFDQFDTVTTPTTEVNPFDAITPTVPATVQSAVEQQPTPGFFTERAPGEFDIKNVTF